MDTEAPKRNRATALKLGVAALAMLGFSFALVPLYDIICDLTGLNGKTGVATQAAVAATQADESRQVEVEFVSVVNRSGNWRFTPEVSRLMAHPGKPYTVHYVAANLDDAPATGQAAPSVAPAAAARYFNKVECFCFSQQQFAAREEKRMPVTFIVDPKLPSHLRIISLSYTLFDVEEQSS